MDLELINTRTEQDFVTQGTAVLAGRIRQNIDEYGHAIVGLSGGSTPKLIYEVLGKEKIDWNNVTVFLVDERYVPSTHADSNQKLIRETLLKNAKIPESQIVMPNTSLPMEECITQYELAIAEMLSKGIPHLVTLGLGEDGHIASLFPPLGDEAFGERLVIHTTTDHFAVHDRISVTMVIIGSADRKIFFLKGMEKKKVWEEMQESFDIQRWPAVAALNLGGGVAVTQW